MEGYRPYSGSWRKGRAPRRRLALVPGADSQHREPDPNLPRANIINETGPATPTLPPEITAAAYLSPVGVPGGPVDQTPRDHSYGMGVGPGLTTEESQAKSGYWHEQDHGAPAVYRYDTPIHRDGARLVDRGPMPTGDSDSPEQHQNERSGVGQPNDPYARVGQRVTRRADMVYDRAEGAWDVEWRAPRARTAGTSQTSAAPPLPVGGSYTLPGWEEPTWGPQRATPDSDITPQERQAPLMGLPQPVPQPDTGLTVWGL